MSIQKPPFLRSSEALALKIKTSDKIFLRVSVFRDPSLFVEDKMKVDVVPEKKTLTELSKT